ncbi:hypothetical protein J7T55_012204 [Diaporthe amygdali]|uniref:uncharacterized protein n=1 Tax=Phomopsis amygdali TaxID=1214568 RepID=UPI0022FEFB56|nr:uncharacterized protein J7T55_012204 [Diaporthe amygdali]KAJ0123735.1 hypothetical protein J7T55_012204 [Diaporthe amygdali]
MPPTRKQGPPFRAEHIGSLLRPPQLRNAILEPEKSTQAALAEITSTAVTDIVTTQCELGFSAPTDGEYQRILFLGSFHLALAGFEDVVDPPIPRQAFRTYLPDVADFLRRGEAIPYTTMCTGRIRHELDRPIYEKEFVYLRSVVEKLEREGGGRRKASIVPKLTLVSPLWYYTLYRKGYAYPQDVYAHDDEYLADLSLAFRKEIDLLYGIGCRNIQVDDPYLTGFCDERVVAGFEADGDDTRKILTKYLRFYNSSLAGKPADLHVGMHMCRGNYINSRHFTTGSYDQIAEALFGQSEAFDTFYLEYDDSRSGTLEPLRHLPRDKNVILGVVSSKFPALEDPNELKARVLQAAQYVAEGTGQTPQQALQQLGVSPQCGFASHVLGNAITAEDMLAKLRLVRQVADALWPGQP